MFFMKEGALIQVYPRICFPCLYIALLSTSLHKQVYIYELHCDAIAFLFSFLFCDIIFCVECCRQDKFCSFSNASQRGVAKMVRYHIIC